MKVGTDSLLFGSWLGQLVQKRRIDCRQGLDIGSGSGLLTMMMAQSLSTQPTQHAFVLHGIELDHPAYRQSVNNVRACPWQDNIQLFHADARHYCHTAKVKYDAIYTNPPYFEPPAKPTNAYHGLESQRAAARIQTGLDLVSLFDCAAQCLANQATFSLVLPREQAQQAIAIAPDFQLHLAYQLRVKTREDKDVSRICLSFTTSNLASHTDDLTIYTVGNEYTEQYRALCRDYYLRF